MKRIFIAIIGLVFASSCTAPSFYEKSYSFNKTLSTGDFEQAEKMIEEHKDLEESKIKFLFLVNVGLVEHLKGDFEKSNEYFNKADLFIEDQRSNALEGGASFLINPNISTYYGEDHEVLLIHYYKALNYHILGKNDDALVEAKRLNLRLQELSEKYTSDNKYSEDAFMHVLIGIIYETNRNVNDAFIAYRNAIKIYEEGYTNIFGFGVPNQLKKDVIRTAALSGIRDEQIRFEKKFDMKYTPDNTTESSVFIFWNNGMGPVKEEWGINFAIIQTGGGWITLVNREYGFSFPFYIGSENLNGLAWVKVVFPRYVERKNLFHSAMAHYDNQSYPLEMGEDINAISFKVLEERMNIEFSKSLIRVVLKQAAAYKIGESQDSPGLGVALSLAASASESADTRNWQTLPREIRYTRIPVNSGDVTILFDIEGDESHVTEHNLEFNINPGETLIYPFYSLGAYEPKTLNRNKNATQK